MRTTVDVLAGLLEAYLTHVDEGDGYAVLEVSEGVVEHLGDFETFADAMRDAAEDFRHFAMTCEEESGEQPDCLLGQVKFIVGPSRVERVITYRKPECDDLSSLPIMVISEPMVGELAEVTAEGLLPPEADDE